MTNAAQRTQRFTSSDTSACVGFFHALFFSRLKAKTKTTKEMYATPQWLQSTTKGSAHPTAANLKQKKLHTLCPFEM